MNTIVQNLFIECLDEYMDLQQNDLIVESKIIRFAKERGIAVSGVVTGDPSRIVELGWITIDSSNGFFHPFRIYPLLRAIKLSRLNITATSSLNRNSFPSFLNNIIELLPSLELIEKEVKLADEISNLAILLEPIYWAKITSKTRLPAISCTSRQEYEVLLKPYRDKILNHVKELDSEVWCSYHERMRTEAAELDDNYELYMMLRLAPWTKREKIKGNIGGALWLRHVAEVIRLAFEEVHGVKWVEEYEAFGIWREGTRTRDYGSERPIENGLITRPHLALKFGLHTGSTIRWYLEGETEYHAALYILPKAALAGIEFINLKGVFQENANAPMRLEDHLKSDRELKRFSFISFDGDVSRNVSFFGKQIEKDNIVGYINVNYPDFEFENFTLNELIEIAISLDEQQGFNSDRLKSGDRGSISSGKAFEKYYKEYSDRKNSLKGKEWGEALASYALDNPLKADTNQRRTLLQTIDQILHARRVSYNYQSDAFKIDINDFKIKEKNEFI